MLFSYNWLQSFFKEKLPSPQKLAELLTLHSFEVQEIKRKNNDWVFDIDITPNRPDCFAHLGIAKEISAILSSKIKTEKSEIKRSKKIEVKDLIKVEVKNKEDCLRYEGGVILGVEVKESPKWMQERLISCGVQPINNIVDATNYVMLEMGQPLHAFDLDKIENADSKIKKIIIRRAKKGEKIEALDDVTYNLDKEILIIADQKNPLAIAGIKGGKKAQITPKTKNIFIESANFAPILIRNMSRQLNLKTDASMRFEHGLDPNLTELALKRVIFLIQETAGGKVIPGIIDVYSKRVMPKRIRVSFEKIEKLLGIKIRSNIIKKILISLDCKVIKENKTGMLVEAPTIRKDLVIEEDIIEEIGRIYGYYKIEPIAPVSKIILPPKDNALVLERKIKNILKEFGFVEVYNYSFIGEGDASFWQNKDLVELENPISSELKYLRPTLLFNLIKNAHKNLKFFESFKLFEMGKIFKWEKNAIKEKKMLSGILTGQGEDSFYILKGYISTFLEDLGISDYFFDSYQPTPDDSSKNFWHLNQSAEIKISGREVGYIGKLSQKILDRYDISQDIFAFDIDYEKLLRFVVEEKEYQPISKYPSVIRDIAVLVPLKTTVDEVQKVIFERGGKMLEDVDLFDIYFGDELPEGKKNLAFHLIFQSKERTLKAEEVNEFLKNIISGLEENPEWEVRK